MIVGDDHRIVISCKTFAFIGQQVMPASVREPSAVHVHHYGPLVGTVDLRCPQVQTKAIFTGNHHSRAAMQEERVFVGRSKVVMITLLEEKILHVTDGSVRQRISDACPRLWLAGWHETVASGSRGTVGHALIAVDPLACEPSHLAVRRLGNCGLTRSHSRAALLLLLWLPGICIGSYRWR